VVPSPKTVLVFVVVQSGVAADAGDAGARNAGTASRATSSVPYIFLSIVERG